MLRPNWFLAFPVPGAFVLELPELPPGFRRFHPEDVHLTLTFLGGCGEQAAERALRALEARLAAEPVASIEIALGKVVPMGSGREYSALSALLERGREATEDCMAALRDVASEAALGRREKRAPKAHVTLARPKRQASAERRAQGLAWASALELSGVTARLDRVALYTWSEARTERLFRIVAERPLRGRRDARGPAF